ncbi:chromatin assembly factor 1 subunit B-like isoform X2 [Lineus longissimus]|uniref:chromatin assembly factor 1 subunit B-like isoform X2 n=1 Tax=Lineus longissimus TaxID=88925 RepID=UPI002B4C6701
MKLCTPEISWHNRDPIFSVDFQKYDGKIQRMVTSGTDKNIRIWQVSITDEGKTKIEFLSTLIRHTRGVNVVRFSPNGEVLASGGDDCAILLWKLSDATAPPNGMFGEEEDDNKETWNVTKTLRGHIEDIYDLCWSPSGKYMITGSVDNSAILWDVHKGKSMAILKEHGSFVQGVAWDPLGKYVATLSCDRCCRIFNIASNQCVHRISKMSLPSSPVGEDGKVKQFRMFHDDTMRSFFRRLEFSPDGQLLIAPAGCLEDGDQIKNTTYIFARGAFSKPAVYLPGSPKATLVVRCCPVLFELRKVPRKNKIESEEGPPTDNENLKEWEKYETMFCLPYRIVFAVATEDSVLLYDTQQMVPFAYIGNIHYHQLSDLTWSSDGRLLGIASTDGYCSIVQFDEGEIGIPTEQKITDFNKNETEIEKDMTKLIDSSDQSSSPPNLNTSLAKKLDETPPMEKSTKVNSNTSNTDSQPNTSEKTKAKKRIQLISLSVDESSKLGPSKSAGDSTKTERTIADEGKQKRRINFTTLTSKQPETSKIVTIDLTSDRIEAIPAAVRKENSPGQAMDEADGQSSQSTEGQSSKSKVCL